MIDEIFEMMMKEARARPGKDLVSNINQVFTEIALKVIQAQEELKKDQRRQGDHED